MNKIRSLTPLLVLIGGILSVGHAADKAPAAANPAEAAKQAPAKTAEPVKPPSETELSAGITKSLGFIEREGEEWMAAKNCNGCHHMPEMLWSHREAKSRGFAVDAKKYEEWLAWAVERSTDKRPGLEEAALMILALPERAAPELTKLIATEQKPDGSWTPAGQFSGMQKRGAGDAQAGQFGDHHDILAAAGGADDADRIAQRLLLGTHHGHGQHRGAAGGRRGGTRGGARPRRRGHRGGIGARGRAGSRPIRWRGTARRAGARPIRWR